MKACACGCGEALRDRRQRGRYIRGHNNRPLKPQYVSDPVSGCWVWNWSVGSGGYGQLRDDEGRQSLAHIVYYERHIGPVPSGFELDHLCRDRRCVNPDHLEPVTHAVNEQRGANARLNWPKVREIRRRARTERYVELAAEFRVSPSNIEHIVHRRRWRHDPLATA